MRRVCSELAGATVVAPRTALGTLTGTGFGASGASQRRRCVSSFSGCQRRCSLPPSYRSGHKSRTMIRIWRSLNVKHYTVKIDTSAFPKFLPEYAS